MTVSNHEIVRIESRCDSAVSLIPFADRQTGIAKATMLMQFPSYSMSVNPIAMNLKWFSDLFQIFRTNTRLIRYYLPFIYINTPNSTPSPSFLTFAQQYFCIVPKRFLELLPSATPLPPPHFFHSSLYLNIYAYLHVKSSLQITPQKAYKPILSRYR